MIVELQPELALDSTAISGCERRLVLGLCECGASMVRLKDGSQICEKKTADKYESTYGKRIKV